jgi:hypothetical protein
MAQVETKTIGTDTLATLAKKHAPRELSFGELLAEGQVAIVITNNGNQPAYCFSKYADAKAFEANLAVLTRGTVQAEIYDHQNYNRIFATINL